MPESNGNVDGRTGFRTMERHPHGLRDRARRDLRLRSNGSALYPYFILATSHHHVHEHRVPQRRRARAAVCEQPGRTQDRLLLGASDEVGAGAGGHPRHPATGGEGVHGAECGAGGHGSDLGAVVFPDHPEEL
eukprot:ctg_10.g2